MGRGYERDSVENEQVSGSILPVYRWQVNYNGTPAAGAKLYSYLSGSSTPSPLYSNADLAIGHRLSNPVVADASGVFPIMYMDALSYRIFITTTDGTTIFPAQDDIYDLWQLTAGTVQNANTVYAGPISGTAAVPTFRALVVADLPTASINVGLCEGRLTLSSGVPVTTADVLAATTVYWTPILGNRIALYDGSAWSLYSFTEKSIAVPASTSQMYDVFIYNNSGTLTLELTAWTNDTTRATALTTQDGVYVKTGATTRRYLGSVRTTAVSGQTEDSFAKRYCWNYYNRVNRPMRKTDATASWNYSSTTRQANGSAANQIDLVCGVSEDGLGVKVGGSFTNSTLNAWGQVAIGEDGTSIHASCIYALSNVYVAAARIIIVASLDLIPAVGRHFYTWLEGTSGDATGTFYSASNGLSGISGSWRA